MGQQPHQHPQIHGHAQPNHQCELRRRARTWTSKGSRWSLQKGGSKAGRRRQKQPEKLDITVPALCLLLDQEQPCRVLPSHSFRLVAGVQEPNRPSGRSDACGVGKIVSLQLIAAPIAAPRTPLSRGSPSIKVHLRLLISAISRAMEMRLEVIEVDDSDVTISTTAQFASQLPTSHKADCISP